MSKIWNGFKNGCRKVKNYYNQNKHWIKPVAGGFALGVALTTEGYIAGKIDTERKYAKKYAKLLDKVPEYGESVVVINEPEEAEKEESKEEGSGYSMKFFDADGNQYGDAIPCYKSYADDIFDCVP